MEGTVSSVDKKIIAVMGSTGSQGGGLVRAIQSDPNGGFKARAITRDPNSDKAKALKDLGAEVVGADIDDEASLVKALNGAQAGDLGPGCPPGHRRKKQDTDREGEVV